MEYIIKIYITTMPSIIAPIITMFWIKTNMMASLNKPIDNNKNFYDGKPIFGKNKTWRGLVFYIITSVVVSLLWGIVCLKVYYLESNNLLYVNHENTILFNLIVGVLFGLAYSLFELPNSFLKRRFDVTSGNAIRSNGVRKLIFRILDITDSAFGCMLVVLSFYHITVLQYFIGVLIGGITHLMIIIILYKIKVKESV